MRAKTEIGQGLIGLRSRRSAAIGMRLVLVALLLEMAASPAAGQNMTHRLNYTPPQNAFRAGIDPSEDYSFNGFNASVQIYQFRPFSGNIVQTFQTTLLRDWIAPMHQEENVAGQPTFQKLEIPGAQIVVTASFAENIVGLAKPHMRMVIISGSEAAIVDASAGTMQSWQMALPALNAMAGTLRVEAARGPAPLTQDAGRSVAGLYMGMKQKYMATMVNVTGSGYYKTHCISISSLPMGAYTGRMTSLTCRAETSRGSTSMLHRDSIRETQAITPSTTASSSSRWAAMRPSRQSPQTFRATAC